MKKTLAMLTVLMLLCPIALADEALPVFADATGLDIFLSHVTEDNPIQSACFAENRGFSRRSILNRIGGGGCLKNEIYRGDSFRIIGCDRRTVVGICVVIVVSVENNGRIIKALGFYV